jgi:hypothetical protein
MTEKVLDRVGSRPVGVLGTGAMGIAFQLEDGRVLKLTRDHDELEAAQALMSKSHPNMVRFYDVFIARNGIGTGVIVRGSVDMNVASLARENAAFLPLAKALLTATRRASDLFYPARVPASQGGWGAPGSTIEPLDVNRKNLKLAMGVWVDTLKNATLKDDFGGDSPSLAHKYKNDAIAGAMFLRKCGVYGFDFHAGNVGIVAEDGVTRGVIYDIGLTSSRARRGIDAERVTLTDILPAFGRMVPKKNPIPEVRA